jgi:hypothetical protein
MGPPTSGSDTRSELPTDPRGRWLAGRSNLRGDADSLKTELRLLRRDVPHCCAQEVRHAP